MGQNISLIITNSTEAVSESIPHFYDGELLIIPVEAKYNYDISELLEAATEKNNYSLQFHLQDFELAEFMSSLNLKSFMFYHLIEHGDMPVQYSTFAVVSDNIIRQSVYDMDSEATNNNYIMAAEFLKLNLAAIDVETYWSYEDCVLKYKKR